MRAAARTLGENLSFYELCQRAALLMMDPNADPSAVQAMKEEVEYRRSLLSETELKNWGQPDTIK